MASGHPPTIAATIPEYVWVGKCVQMESGLNPMSAATIPEFAKVETCAQMESGLPPVNVAILAVNVRAEKSVRMRNVFPALLTPNVKMEEFAKLASVSLLRHARITIVEVGKFVRMANGKPLSAARTVIVEMASFAKINYVLDSNQLPWSHPLPHQIIVVKVCAISSFRNHKLV